jgi:hypothetical protein
VSERPTGRSKIVTEKAIVNIAGVKTGTTPVAAEDLRKGYTVFDAHGGEHTLARDARRLANGMVSVKRSDYPAEHFAPGTMFTCRTTG